ncbi:MAG: UDP-N-acetylmuramoyl-L-alanine--D-glutamate ligase [Nitrospiria bacterium]
MKRQLNKKHVSVVGMGKSGMAAAALLSRQGADVLVVDDRDRMIDGALPESFRCRLGGWREEDLTSADLVVLSPGVSLDRLPVARLKALGVPLIGEVELAAGLLSAPMIGITGSNGKSTTTTLAGEILRDWGWAVFVGGNLGPPLSEAVSTHSDFIVAELSSFQLETVSDLRPRIAALLNITPDHLDRYPDISAYRQAKWRIFENQTSDDHAVLNFDDPASHPPFLQANPIYFSRHRSVRRGVYLQEGAIVSTIRGEPEAICRLDSLPAAQACHEENILAAVAITLLCGCSVEGIARTLQRFKGLPHRMEFVRERRGVRYLNDSKGTNVGAVTGSLERLRAPVTLIAGGRDKDADFRPLAALVREKVKHMILLGESKEKMARVFSGLTRIETAESMEEALALASDRSRPGDMVLLSPGCASYDLFRDYRHRGEVFKKLVMDLPE